MRAHPHYVGSTRAGGVPAPEVEAHPHYVGSTERGDAQAG